MGLAADGQRPATLRASAASLNDWTGERSIFLGCFRLQNAMRRQCGHDALQVCGGIGARTQPLPSRPFFCLGTASSNASRKWPSHRAIRCAAGILVPWTDPTTIGRLDRLRDIAAVTIDVCTRPQRVTIQFETGDPLECRGFAGGVIGADMAHVGRRAEMARPAQRLRSRRDAGRAEGAHASSWVRQACLPPYSRRYSPPSHGLVPKLLPPQGQFISQISAGVSGDAAAIGGDSHRFEGVGAVCTGIEPGLLEF